MTQPLEKDEMLVKQMEWELTGSSNHLALDKGLATPSKI